MMLSRRRFGLAACACGALLGSACKTTDELSREAVDGQPLEAETPIGYRPHPSSDEAGIWALADKEEAQLRNSPHLVRDPVLNAYVRTLCESLAGERRQDMRVYVVRAPMFNATMSPNGMMQVWTGLLVRAENEAQLASVLGHEIGHYARRHSIYRQRDIVNKTGLATFMALAGVYGSAVNLAILQSMLAYSRDHEREADRWGSEAMARQRLDPQEASTIWKNIIAEEEAYEDRRSRSLGLATHPAPEERMTTLASMAAVAKRNATFGYKTNEAAYRATLKNSWLWLLRDELRLRTYPSSLVLFERLLKRDPKDAHVWYAKGELFRLRDATDDDSRAQQALHSAVALPNHPPVAWRSLGFLHQRKRRFAEAVTAFQSYLASPPADADDLDLIKNYVANGGQV
jgi:predicted Zn-dependent protease